MFLDQIVLKKNKLNLKKFILDSEDDQINSLEQLDNIASNWKVERPLKAKVGSDGMLRDFYGDTIILPVKVEDQKKFDGLRNQFSSLDMFAEKLDSKLFHMTVHDLSNGKRTKKLEEKVKENQDKCEKIFTRLKEYIENNSIDMSIRMKSTYVYPSANVAVVCGLIPARTEDFNILLNIYNLFEDVIYLYYEPRFHITLNYFQNRVFKSMEVKELYSILKNVRPDFEVEFELKDLLYQQFLNMNLYQSIIGL